MVLQERIRPLWIPLDSDGRRILSAEAWERFIRNYRLDQGAALWEPKHFVYSDWKKKATPLIQALLSKGIQGNHFWPKVLGGAYDEGLVHAVSSPMLHQGFLHARMQAYLSKRLGFKRTVTWQKISQEWRLLDQSSEEALFNAQKTLLQEFYEQELGIRFPDFIYNPTLPGSGRGVLSVVQPSALGSQSRVPSANLMRIRARAY